MRKRKKVGFLVLKKAKQRNLKVVYLKRFDFYCEKRKTREFEEMGLVRFVKKKKREKKI